jgi:hypothetical protein
MYYIQSGEPKAIISKNLGMEIFNPVQ